jgi:hypothetical protein
MYLELVSFLGSFVTYWWFPFSFSTEDHLALAIVYLRTCSLDEAIEELLSLTKVR